MQTTSIKNLGNEHSEWKKALGFYKDELGVYKNRLTEVAGKNTGMETMQQVEHFQNSFLVQLENIDTLQHDINVHLGEMAAGMQQHAGHISKEQADQYALLKDRYEAEAGIFTEMKKDFNRFLTQTM